MHSSSITPCIMTHDSGTYVGMTRKKYGRPYIRINRIFVEYVCIDLRIIRTMHLSIIGLVIIGIYIACYAIY